MRSSSRSRSARHVFTRVRIPGEREVDLDALVQATGAAALAGTPLPR